MRLTNTYTKLYAHTVPETRQNHLNETSGKAASECYRIFSQAQHPCNIPSSSFTDNPPQRGLHSKRSLCFRDPFISRRELRTSIVDSALKSALAVTIQSSRVIKSAGNVSNRVM